MLSTTKSRHAGKKLILFLFLLGASCLAQDITNTLAPNSKFIVKDASNNYLAIDQLTGQVNIMTTLRLENTTSPSVGVILKGADRFMHNYGANNTFIGKNAGNFIMTGGLNTALGVQSLFSNTTGTSNISVGYGSLKNNNTGNDNIAIGYLALNSNTEGEKNTAVGYMALSVSTYRGENTAVGYRSLSSNTMGHENTAVGYSSLSSNTEGFLNTALGYNALTSNTIGFQNTAVGDVCLSSNTSGYANTALGWSSLSSNTTGHQNTALGPSSLVSNTTGAWNTAVGLGSSAFNTTGNFNTAMGYNSMYFNTSGMQNTAVGYYSLFNSNGNDNTAIGWWAGYNITTGSNLTCIGNYAQPSSGDAFNQITLGDGYVTSLRCNVTTITSLSDARDKKNIKDLDLGIDFLMNIKPRQFNWDRREWYEGNISDGSKMQEVPTAGFIAQELDEAQTEAKAEWLNLVLKDNSEKWEATPGNLLPIMVKAIQELKVENEQLKNQLAELADIKVQIAEIDSLKDELKEQIKILKASNSVEQVKFTSILIRGIDK